MENPIVVPFDLNTVRKIKSGEIEGSVLINNIEIEFVYESKDCAGPYNLLFVRKDEYGISTIYANTEGCALGDTTLELRNLLEDGEYIPSLGQLNLMAHYMDELNKAFAYVSASPLSSTWYWSSTESSQDVAWYVVFSSGLTGTGNKHIGDMVRTVIDF
jgi:hypothetical protein